MKRVNSCTFVIQLSVSDSICVSVQHTLKQNLTAAMKLETKWTNSKNEKSST